MFYFQTIYLPRCKILSLKKRLYKTFHTKFDIFRKIMSENFVTWSTRYKIILLTPKCLHGNLLLFLSYVLPLSYPISLAIYFPFSLHISTTFERVLHTDLSVFSPLSLSNSASSYLSIYVCLSVCSTT